MSLGEAVWVLDRRNHRLVVIGDSTRSVDREGGGPGEYRDLNFIADVGGGGLAVWDHYPNRITFLNGSGRVDSTTTVDVDLHASDGAVAAVPLRGGYLVMTGPNLKGGAAPRAEADATRVIRVTPSRTDTLATFARFGPITEARPLTDGHNGTRLYVVSAITNGVAQFDHTAACGGVFASTTETERLTVLLVDSEGERRVQARLDLVGPEIPRDVRNRYLSRFSGVEREIAEASIPPRYGPSRRLVASASGRLWVQVEDGERGSSVWLVFAIADLLEEREGPPARVRFPDGFRLLEERDGTLWGVAIDDMGVESLQRYRLPPASLPRGCG